MIRININNRVGTLIFVLTFFNTYFYNEEGIRVKKVSEDDYTKEYILEGNKILCENILKLNNESNTYSLIGQLFYHYDLNNELVSVENEGNIYFYVKDLLGVIHKLVDVNGNTVVQYLYDGWRKLINSYTGSVNAFVAQYNPFIYKSYYYDKETGLFWLCSRYYSPELCRFIQPANISNLNPRSINGLNLFSYVNNNPICSVKLFNSANVGMLSGFSTITKLPSYKLPITNSNVGSRNYWDPHIKGKWFDTYVPEFFNFTHDKIEFVNWSFSVYKGSLYFDHNENHSLYIAGGNISTYLGIGSEGIGLDLGANVLEIGYDGRIFDANVEFLTVGLTFMYKDGTFEFGVGAGWFGYSVTIDIDEIIKIIFGG